MSELQFKAVRSSGAGGQNVNKVSSKIILIFNLETSQAFTEEEKTRIAQKLANRISNDGLLQIQADEDRSQLKNKKIAINRFLEMISSALVIVKPRTATKIPKSVIKKRLKDKRSLSQIKQNRQKPKLD